MRSAAWVFIVTSFFVHADPEGQPPAGGLMHLQGASYAQLPLTLRVFARMQPRTQPSTDILYEHACINNYCTLYHEELTNADSSRIQERAVSFAADPRHAYQQQYQLNERARNRLRRSYLAADQFGECYGTRAQQALHAECIEVLDVVSAYEHSRHDALVDATTRMADAACSYNHAGKLRVAVTCLDWCWSAITCLKTMSGAVAHGAVRGAWQTIERIAHPIETVQSTLSALAALGKCTAALVHEVGALSWLALHNPFSAWRRARDDCARIAWLANTLLEKARNIPPDQFVEHGVAFLTETILTGKLSGALGAFFRDLRPYAAHWTRKEIARYAPSMRVATPEGLQCSLVNKAIREVKKYNTSAHGHRIAGEYACKARINENIDQTIARLAAKWGDALNITPERINHILRGELSFDRLSGCHTLQGARALFIPSRIRIEKILPNGVMLAKFLLKNGRWEKKTLFPLEWRASTLMQKINEASHKVSEMILCGVKLEVTGKTSCGLEIRIIKKMCGKLVTAYPYVESL